VNCPSGARGRDAPPAPPQTFRRVDGAGSLRIAAEGLPVVDGRAVVQVVPSLFAEAAPCRVDMYDLADIREPLNSVREEVPGTKISARSAEGYVLKHAEKTGGVVGAKPSKSPVTEFVTGLPVSYVNQLKNQRPLARLIRRTGREMIVETVCQSSFGPNPVPWPVPRG
jgi:hypothetical protein